MEDPFSWGQLLLGLIGVGGFTTIISKWMDNRSKALTETNAIKIEAAQAAESSGLLKEWERLANETSEQNSVLWEQNQALWVQNRELTDQNKLLREAHSDKDRKVALALGYIGDLRTHIHRELPPPAPPWPDGLSQ